MERITRRTWQAFLAGQLLAASLALAAEPVRLTVAVVPQFSPVQIHQEWTPLLQRLTARTGLQFQLLAYEKIPAFEAELLKGVPDLAFMNPYHMVMAHKAQGYRPLVRDGASALAGILVVRADSPLQQLSDLQGKKLAFPSPNAFGASLFMRALLAEKEKIAFQAIYAGNHQNVYRQVLRGEVQAGGGIEATLTREPQAVRELLRVLYTTPEAAPHPLAIHPRVPAATRQKILMALLELRQAPEGRALLERVQMPGLVEADYARDYAPLGRLNLERYVEMPAR